MSIEVQNVVKSYGSHRVVDGLDLRVESGEMLALLGASGSGKSTLLRLIAGLEWCQDGRVLIDGRDMTRMPANQRRTGLVFQNYALFRHLNCFENIAFSLKVRPGPLRPSADAIRKRVRELLDLMQLPEIAERFPHQLSGGQRQRVALARAIASEPRVLLLDEPFGALDAQVRLDLRQWLRKIHDELHITSIFVTHDREEALAIADRVVHMRQGRIIAA